MKSTQTITTKVESQRWQSFVVDKQPGCWKFALCPVVQPPPLPPVKTVKAVTIPLCKQPLYDRDPLTVFVAKSGGINPAYGYGMRAGEIRRITSMKRLPPGAVNRQAKLRLEEMAERAWEKGYTVEPDMEAFLDALEEDVAACDRGDVLGRVYSFDAFDWLTGERSKEYEENYEDAAFQQ